MSSRARKKGRQIAQAHAEMRQNQKDIAALDLETAKIDLRIENRMNRLNQMEAGSFSSMQAGKQMNFQVKYQAHDLVRRSLEHNGITLKDLEEARESGYEEGFKRAALPIIKCCYAGICIALHDEFGFGEKRCFRAITAVDNKVIWALNHSELVDEVLEKTGLILDLDDPFDRIQQKNG